MANTVSLEELVDRMRKQYIHDLRLEQFLVRSGIHGFFVRNHGFEDTVSYYCLDFIPGAFNTIALDVVPQDGKDNMELLKTLEHELKESVKDVVYDAVSLIERTTLTFVLNFSEENLEISLRRFSEAWRKFFDKCLLADERGNRRVYFGQGCLVYELKDLRHSLDYAIKALETAKISANNEWDGEQEPVVTPDNLQIFGSSEETLLLGALETMDMTSFSECVYNIFNQNEETIRPYPHLYYDLARSIMMFSYHQLQDMFPFNEDIPMMLPKVSADLGRCISPDALRQCLILSMADAFSLVKNAAAQKGNNYIFEAKRFILNNYTRKLTIREVAEHVHLNHQYFCVLFKSETGESFVEYLTGVRLNAAMNLLQNTGHNIEAIAVAVGYNDAKYFSRVFRNKTGLLPTDYRRRLIKSEQE